MSAIPELGPVQEAQEADVLPARALRSTAVYSASTALQRGLMFLLLPVFTFVLSPAEYGELSIVLAIYAVASVAFSLGLDLAVFRTYFQLADDPRAQRRFVGSIWTSLLVGPAAAAAVLGAISIPILGSDGVVDSLQFTLALLGAALYVSATTVPLSLLRAEQRLRKFILINVVAALATTACTLMLVVWARAGVTGWLVAVVLANLATLVAALIALEYRRPPSIDRGMVRDALRLSLPTVPHFLAHWALQLADRLVLSGLVVLSAVGIYGVAANLALPLMILVGSINHGLMPHYAHAGTSREVLRSLPDLVGIQVGLVAMLSLVFGLLASPVIHLIIDADFSGAAELTPWLVLGYAFFGFYCIPMNAVGLVLGRTQYIWVVTLLSAAVNLAVILIFVPDHGLEAAAIASAVGYLALLVGTYLYARRVGDPIPYPWGTIARVLGVCLAGYVLAVNTVGGETVADAVFRTLWIAATGAIVIAASGIPLRRIRELW